MDLPFARDSRIVPFGNGFYFGDNAAWEVVLLDSHGRMLLARGETERARRLFEEQLTVARERGDRISEARAHRNPKRYRGNEFVLADASG